MKRNLLTLSVLFLASITLAAEKPAEYTSADDIAKDETLLRDFSLQGEYLGKVGDQTFGADLIADGDGKFRVVAFLGGLPGDGWKRGDTRIFGTAVFKDGALDVVLNEVEDAQGRRKIDDPKPFTAKIDGTRLNVASPDDGKEYPFVKQRRKSPTEGQAAPDGAVVLFADGVTNEAMWAKANVNEEAKTLWSEATTKPFEKKPYTMHVEFLLSYMPTAKGQARSNSGVYIDQAYECQVLDSFGLDGKNNECGGFYQVAEPIVNMCFPPLRWQTYDIDFAPAVFNADGQKTTKAKITVRHNGVTIHEGIEPEKETPGCKKESPEARGLYLQGHGNKVQYRNIWLKYESN